MAEEHIVSSFDRALNKMQSLVLEMGNRVEAQLALAAQALQTDDIKLTKKVITDHRRIRTLEAEINTAALNLLALRHPVAIDLRRIMMSLRIAGHLERIGQYAKNMARRTRTISKAEAFDGSLDLITRMSERVQNMIRAALNAYTTHDAEQAEHIREQDEYVDQMHNTMFRELLTYMMQDTRNISGSMHVLFIAKNIERMGDHTTEIAEEIVFMVTGKWPNEKRTKRDKTSRILFHQNDANQSDDQK